MQDMSILKNEEAAVFALRALYKQYGYLPYKMSKFEDYEYYIRNKDFLVSDRIITFNDQSGRLLALKPDVTLSIIKNGEDTPGCKQKVYYNEHVYRISDSTHQFKEIMQAGLECVGDIDLYDIYEVVALAAQSLCLISPDFVLQISHQGILSGVLDCVCKDAAFQQAAIGFIAEKNTHDLNRLCESYGVDGAPLTKILSAYGPRDKVLTMLGDMEGLRELQALSALLDGLPQSDNIIFDFSVVNNMNYYNGIVFQGYLSGICESVLAGGRYDKLMQKLDRKAGAVGFALYLDLLEQLPQKNRDYDVDVLLLYTPDTDKTLVAQTVSRLTAGGKTVSAQKSIPPKLRYKEVLTC